ncbi:MAG: antibiotic biosynthesis monooxygenase family protein [Candidatus Acidiferrales bacterium]
MYSRLINLKMKNEMIREFPYAFEKEILPLLRKQKGFLDELLLVAPGKTEFVSISLWENKEFAEIYNREFYPEIVKIMNKYVDGVPVVKNFEVEYATFPSFQTFVAVTA